jgi:hypothetical protein
VITVIPLPTTADCDVCGHPITDINLVRRHAKRHRGQCHARWRSERSRRFYHERRDERIAYARAYRKDRPVLAAMTRRRRRLAFYGLDEESYGAMNEAQAGACAICHEPEHRLSRGLPTPLSVDHDHATGVVRGLLCARCNSVLGLMEQPGWMAAAGAYLNAAATQGGSTE